MHNIKLRKESKITFRAQRVKRSQDWVLEITFKFVFMFLNKTNWRWKLGTSKHMFFANIFALNAITNGLKVCLQVAGSLN